VGRKTNRQRRQQDAASAREKAAIARAASARAERNRRATVVLGSVVVFAIVGVLIAVIAINSSGKNNTAGNRVAASPTVVKQVADVTPATLQTVGQGSIGSLPKKISDAPLTKGGKPEMLFVGGEFCPYCAAERWSMVQALSRFGTFSNLSEISSSSTDTDPNTPTFSFYKSNYASKYVSFVPVENEDRSGKQLVPMTTAEEKIFTKYTNGFPFVDFGGKYIITTPSYDPATLKGLTQAQVAAQLNDPKSKVAQGVDGAANAITAAICSMTNNQPANVCLTPEVTNLQSKLNA
jgi:thiol-disulfide isomerase/thioredoxin